MQQLPGSYVICGTFWGYGWDKVAPFAHSIIRSGYKGKKVIFVRDVSDEVINNFKALGFEVISFAPTQHSARTEKEWGKFDINNHAVSCRTRWEPFLDYFRDYRPEWIIVTDVSDVVFQKDPFQWLEKRQPKLVGATESITVGDEWTEAGCFDGRRMFQENLQWCKAAVGTERAMSVANEEVICHGTIAGRGDHVYHYIKTLYDILATHPSKHIVDQGPGQWLLRQPPFKDWLTVPRLSEGFILSGNFCWRSRIDPPPDIRNGIGYPKGSQDPFCMYHMHRYHPEVPARYAILGKCIGPNETCTTHTVPAWWVNRRARASAPAAPGKRRGDNLVREWVPRAARR
jgi:hypothetical protein